MIRNLLRLLLAAYFLCGFAPAAPSARPGILIMAHGDSPDWNAAVEEAAAPLGKILPVTIAFGMAQPHSIEMALVRLQSQGVTHVAVVRLFVSDESFRGQIEYLLGLQPEPPPIFLEHSMEPGLTPAEAVKLLPPDAAPPAVRHNATLALNRQGLYDSARTSRILVDRVKALSVSPSNESVLIIAHGEGNQALNQKWISRVEALASRVRDFAPFQQVRVETLQEDWPEERREAERRIRNFVQQADEEGGDMLVVPFRVFGFGPYAEVLEGLEYKSDGKGLLPHHEVTEWIKDQAEDCFKQMDIPPVFTSGKGADGE